MDYRYGSLDRPFEADYVGFDIEDLFVVGYGLDVNEQFRNLPGIHYVVE